MKDGLGTDCQRIIDQKLSGLLNFEGFISELELLDYKYPGLGFADSISNLRAWKAKQIS